MQKMGPQTHLGWRLEEGWVGGWMVRGKGFLRGEIVELGPDI